MSLARAWFDAWVDLDCPTCNYPVEVQVVDVACQVYRRCPCCLTNIHLIDAGGASHTELAHSERVIENAIKGLFS